MPKVEIDYSNTLFYKIFCSNSDITDLYIGHTTNFVQRKHAHKQCCKNENASNHKCKLYKFIREHGGWENWKMEIIAFHDCDDHYSARKREQEYFIEYSATLNSIEPMPSRPTIQREKQSICLTQTNPPFTCEKCTFVSSNKKDYNRHLLTPKHNRLRNTRVTQIPNQCEFCNKQYRDRSGLWRHNRKCRVAIKSKPPIRSDTFENEFIDTLLQMDEETQTHKIPESLFNMVLEKYKETIDAQKETIATLHATITEQKHIICLYKENTT